MNLKESKNNFKPVELPRSRDQLKRIADELAKKTGQARGIVGELEANYIRDQKGEEGLKKLERELNEIGHPFSYDQLNTYGWYQESQFVTGILAACMLFDWGPEDIYKLGKKAPYSSIFIKVIMKFVSLDATLKTAPTIWSKHYDFGTFFVYDHDTEEKVVRARMHGYDYHPIMPPYFCGYLSTIMSLGAGVSDVELRHGECENADNEVDICDEYHAYY